MSKTFTSYALLGSGRVARHLQHYLSGLQLPCTTWSRSSGPLDLAGASHVLLAVSDPAIHEVAAQVGPDPIKVHFSGSAQVEGVFAAHPLMTFGGELKSLPWYRDIPFVIDKGIDFQNILPGLPNASFALAPEHRALYHALCALAGNSTFLLWQNIATEFAQTLRLPAETLAPFLHEVVNNALSAEAPARATGPVARQDWSTIRRHLHSLEQKPHLLSAYRQFLHQAAAGGQHIPEALL